MVKFRSLLQIIFDAFLIILAYYVALLLKFKGSVPADYVHMLTGQITYILIIQIVVFVGFNLYKTIWEYASIKELINIFSACFIGAFINGILMYMLNPTFPRSVYITAFIFEVTFIGGQKFLNRVSLNTLGFKKNLSDKNIMIIGAGDAGVLVIKEIQRHKEIGKPKVFVDDSKSKLGKVICGVPVGGNRNDIPDLVEKYSIDEIVVAMPSISFKDQKEILEICSETGKKIKILPGIYEFIEGQVDIKEIRDVQIEDLLGRDEIKMDEKSISNLIQDKVVMITGAGGSIGSELCRQIVKFNPKLLVMVDIYENNIYDIQNELKRFYPNAKLDVLIDTIRDENRMDSVFGKYRPEIVFHAAAHKHVPLMEHSSVSAVKNNVFGTLNLIKMSDKYGVDKFVNISTDKAVNPTSVMGTTKRICEIMIQAFNEKSNTDFVAVRFGNVLGSNGSVIPLFKKQIAEGGPVTVTHEEIIRYFMTITEACQLVMQAGAIAKGGEIFILDMGESVKILDLAKRLIKLSGFELGKDIEIKITGLRPGEKLYEELLLNMENASSTEYRKIFIEKPIKHDYAKLVEDLDSLKKIIEHDDKLSIIKALQEIVPNYVPDVINK